MNTLFIDFLPKLFLILLAASLASSLILLVPRIHVRFVRIHIGIITLPPIVALLALVTKSESENFGPWHLDSLSWLVAGFVLTIGLIVQRFSLRYLLGDSAYRKYFSLLTITTVADSAAWLSNDLRWLLVCWGITLLGLTILLKLNKHWQVAKSAAAFSGKMFMISWLILLVAIVWLTQATGYWNMSEVLSKTGLQKLPSWEKTSINLLLILAVIIPGAQWPFHRWLLDSVVAPTPVSAVMHAGIVNVGGILLTKFAPLFSDNFSQMVLLILASFSVLIGTGIMLVQADYKRQLVGSTIAQMGFMLIQCALGAYVAAIIHAVLHGLFKSTLFLQAGSAVSRKKTVDHPTKMNLSRLLFTIVGWGLGGVIGVGIWLIESSEGYQIISALILGWSISFAWMQLVASATSILERLAGFSILAVAAFVYGMIHEAFYGMLQESIQQGIHPHPLSTVTILFLIVLILSTVGMSRLARNRSSAAYAMIYLWLIRLGEPNKKLVESHPKYLAQNLSQGGQFR